MKTIAKILIVVLSLAVQVLKAQELEIQSFKRSVTDIIAKKDQRLDMNGDFCALVKVQIVDEIDHVDGNVMGEIVNRGSEKWVYFSQGTKEFRIVPKNYQPVHIVCNDYGINGLRSKRVYVLKLKGNDNTVVVVDTVIVEREKEVEKIVIQEKKTRFNVYLQPAAQAGTMMGFGGNIGFYVSNFNVEAYVTSTMGKESVNLISNGSSSTIAKADMSGLQIGGKVGYDFKVSSIIHVVPQVGLGSLSVKGGDISTSVMCASVGVRVEFGLGKNFGISLTPEGQFAVSKQDIFRQLSDVSTKIKGWGTGANVRLGLYLLF